MKSFICRTIARRFTKGMALAVVTTLGPLNGLESASASNFVVGGFDVSRGGAYSFPAGVFLDQARASLSANFPGASIASFPNLTPAALAGVDVLILTSASSNNSHIAPLSAAEQSALLAFVQGGGCAILFPDNDRFGGGGTPAANESLIDPFGLDIAGTANGLRIATVADPSASSITSGPFGVVSSFSQNFPGGLTNLGPFAISLATNVLGTALAVIEKGAISPGSGRVVIYTDINTFGDSNASSFFPQNELLFLNTIDFCLVEITVVDVDIKPGSCPNPLNPSSVGYIPISILGSADFDPLDIDLSTVLLSRADGFGGFVAPNEGPSGPHSVFEDTATPFDGELCDCHALEGDGIDDLSMKFETQVVVAALELDDESPGTVLELVVSGELLDGTAFVGSDCIVIVGGG